MTVFMVYGKIVLYCRENGKEIKVKDPKPPQKREMTPERQKILDQAFKQYKKSRKRIDSGILQKIKRFVEKYPYMQKMLGFSPPPKSQQYEKIDRQHNQSVIEKFLELNPDQKDAVRDLLPDKKKLRKL